MQEILKALNEKIFPSFVEIEIVKLKHFDRRALPEEEELISHAGEKRKKEFRSGRYCCGKALERLGIKDFPILFDEKRSPIWPDGFCGSITHSKDLCIAVISKKKDTISLGVDIETLGRLKEKLWKAILTQKEMKYVYSLPAKDQSNTASLIFSIKECFYKYQYPLTKLWLGFLDAEVQISQDESSFEIHLLKENHPPLKPEIGHKGKFSLLNNVVITGMY